ncbi:hypothetical protein [Glycomyces lechevalierae]|uniref:Uncharacterized protein n=1 Tax=Glycomyces lechevalierae TaxID=256034 RepID=A0ABU2AHZ4_9ACTN|nr:hypothetical protein [Glycomyces lechevalierae]MDR7336821.1 hypothetical protein [Glycomyces lechevalierae]
MNDCATGGIVKPGPGGLIGGDGPNCLIPNPLARTLERATVVHLQPSDVVVFSNVGDVDPEQCGTAIERLKEALGGKTLVFFHGPIDITTLRDLEQQ